jgi:hypothetical protein
VAIPQFGDWDFEAKSSCRSAIGDLSRKSKEVNSLWRSGWGAGGDYPSGGLVRVIRQPRMGCGPAPPCTAVLD